MHIVNIEVGALRISLQGTRQQFNHFRPEMQQLGPSEQQRDSQALLSAVRELIIPYRPNRSEPRVVKRCQQNQAIPTGQCPERPQSTVLTKNASDRN
ncbi:MAG: hypothetical protein ACTS2F_30550 [Thainema sp.]